MSQSAPEGLATPRFKMLGGQDGLGCTDDSCGIPGEPADAISEPAPR